MKVTNKKGMSTRTMVLGGVLTALVVVLQMLGQFIRLGPFAISPVQIVIVVGAALCGVAVSTWLGAVFGAVVLLTDAAAFLAISVPATIFVVMAKGVLCGFVAGVVFKLLERFNRYVAVMAAALAAAVTNTGVFVLGCFAFFFKTLTEWGLAAGFENAFQFVILGMVGLNFLVELALAVLLSPLVVRFLQIVKKH